MTGWAIPTDYLGSPTTGRFVVKTPSGVWEDFDSVEAIQARARANSWSV